MNSQTLPNLQHLVVVRPEPPGQFTAEALGLPELRATCASREEAINRVRLQLCHWFASGQLVSVEIERVQWVPPNRVWLENDPDRDAYLEEIRRYREEVDAQFQREEAEQACSNSSSTPIT
jgi:hypothetical protein